MANVYDIEAVAGTDFIREMALNDSANAPIDLTGYTVKMQVRRTATSPNAVAELSTANSKITITGNVLRLVLASAETAALPVVSMVYDVILTSPSGLVTQLLRGGFTVTARVTQ